MGTIPRGHTGELDVSQLRVIDTLLRERSLTRAALVLDTSQPALSKALGRLRRYFDDPLFVRVALHMQPTARALEIEAPVRAILERMQTLRSQQLPFDPRKSRRTFNFFMVDAAVVVMVPPIAKFLLQHAPHIHLRAVQLNSEHLHAWLETGKVDFAIGAFPSLTQGIRKQRLFGASYLSLSRKGHPRLGRAPSARAFIAERHVLVSGAGTGHALQVAETALEAAIPAENLTVRVPGFTAAALVAKHTDAVTTLPSPLALVLARELDLELIKPPIELPKLEIAQYWHERFHREPGNQWIRSVFYKELSGLK
jgi:DNA-binding transcriptional LysR family regulator